MLLRAIHAAPVIHLTIAIVFGIAACLVGCEKVRSEEGKGNREPTNTLIPSKNKKDEQKDIQKKDEQKKVQKKVQEEEIVIDISDMVDGKARAKSFKHRQRPSKPQHKVETGDIDLKPVENKKTVDSKDNVKHEKKPSRPSIGVVDTARPRIGTVGTERPAIGTVDEHGTKKIQPLE